jgi:hypothetical protein
LTFALDVVRCRRKLADKNGNPIPNGPTGIPILGSFLYLFFCTCRLMNRLQDSFPFLTHYSELTLRHWAKIFGLLYSMWLENQLFVVVSDPNIAKDLMVTNGAIFSSRKEMFIKSQTVFARRGITATPYNDRW